METQNKINESRLVEQIAQATSWNALAKETGMHYTTLQLWAKRWEIPHEHLGPAAQVKEGACANCGESFYYVNANQGKFCSASCNFAQNHWTIVAPESADRIEDEFGVEGIAQAIRQSSSLAEAGRFLGCSGNCVKDAAGRLGIEIPGWYIRRNAWDHSDLVKAVAGSVNWTEVGQALGLSMATSAVRKAVEDYGISTDHFTYLGRDASVEDRFYAKVDEGEDGCWYWKGARNRGYGQFQGTLAHRWAYDHFIGGDIDGLSVHHECHNALCVNPNHLRPMDPGEHSRLHARERAEAA